MEALAATGIDGPPVEAVLLPLDRQMQIDSPRPLIPRNLGGLSAETQTVVETFRLIEEALSGFSNPAPLSVTSTRVHPLLRADVTRCSRIEPPIVDRSGASGASSRR